jgi:transposase
VQVEVTWDVYQAMIAAYRAPDRAHCRDLLTKLITSLSKGVPTALTELGTLGRTLKQRADDVLAYFERPGTSNGPTEAINGRLEHLRGSALGFRNLTNTSPDPCSSPEDSDLTYTLVCEEPGTS